MHRSKFLGVTITDDLSWITHVDNITKKANQRLYMLRLLVRARVSIDKLISIYLCKIRPVVEYACQVWHGSLGKELAYQLESVQRRALRIIMPDADYKLALEIAKIPSLEDRRKDLCKKLFVEMQCKDHRLHHLLPPVKVNHSRQRSDFKYHLTNATHRSC